jgi:thymidylate synthase
MDYPEIVRAIEREGSRIDSRVGPIAELAPASLVLSDPLRCVVDRDKFSRSYMNLESTMLAAGVYDEKLTKQMVPRAADLLSQLTAYGPRTRTQMQGMELELKQSPLSRRAVVYVGRPNDLDSAETVPGFKKEMPCTMTWQFLLRDGFLDMIVNMRSWDAIWGLSYDVPSFVTMQVVLADALGVPVGKYFHVAGSFHVYVERDLGIEIRINDDSLFSTPFRLCGSVVETQQSARELLEAVRNGAKL